MTVNTARDHISQIDKITEKAISFVERHDELEAQTTFIYDAVAFLGDYKKLLEKHIGEAELKI